MDYEKFAFKWHTYTDHLRGMMKEMMTSEDFADVTLVSDDKKIIKAHRNILSTCSPVFKDILYTQTQSNHPVIYLRGIQYSEIESILQFMYLGEAKFYEERMNEFLFVVKNLEIKELSNGFESKEPELHHTPIELTKESFDRFNENTEDLTSDEDKLFSGSVTLNNHTKEFKKGVKYSCNQCDHQFTQQSSLKTHIRSVHEGVKYACNQCDYQATQRSSLTIHIQSQHEGFKYACNQCDYQATHQWTLTVHIQSKHEGIRYACNQCDHQATNKRNLKDHIQSVHEGVKYTCNKCDHQFTTQSHLKSHIQSVHDGVKYACTKCDYQATKQNNLTRHIRTVHQDQVISFL